MNEIMKEKLNKIINWVVLCCLGVFSYFYSIFWSNFAELNIQLPFLNFPIFIGEILLGFCIVMFFIKWKSSPIQLNRWHYLLFAYVLFILFKAFYGYLEWGPLAFRNAALFYYPLFMIVGYYFYESNFFKNKLVGYGLLILLISTVFFEKAYKTYYFTYIFLVLVFLMKIENRRLKGILIVLFLSFCHRAILFTVWAGRNSLVSSFFSYLFIFTVIVMYFIKIKPIYKIATVVIIFLFSSLFYWHICDKGSIKSLGAFMALSEKYRKYSKIIEEKKENFKFADPPVKIYEKNHRLFVEKKPALTIKEEPEGDEFKAYSREKLIAIILESEQKNHQLRLELVEEASVVKAKPEMESVSEASVVKVEPEMESVSEASVVKVEPEMELVSEASIVKVEPEMELTPEAIIVKPERRTGRKPKIGNIKADSKTEQISEAIVVKLESETKIETTPVDKKIIAKKIKKLSKEKLTEIILKNEQFASTAAKTPAESHPHVLSNGEEVSEGRSVDVLQKNIFYRMFIWQDMMEEVFEGKKLLGADFGKPFRSKKLEISRFDESWKTRVGWVEPHNAYVHMIYRAGIVGILFIIAVVSLFIKMVVAFIKIRSIKGVFLVSILLYWLIISNFMVILELPHWAIPFWCLFGIVLRYSYIQKEKRCC